MYPELDAAGRVNSAIEQFNATLLHVWERLSLPDEAEVKDIDRWVVGIAQALWLIYYFGS